MTMDARRDGWRRIGAMIALIALSVFVLLGQPAEARLAAGASVAVAAAAEPPGDLDHGHHPPGAHCANHCAGHAAWPSIGTGLRAPPAARLRYAAAADAEREAHDTAPPIRPPAA